MSLEEYKEKMVNKKDITILEKELENLYNTVDMNREIKEKINLVKTQIWTLLKKELFKKHWEFITSDEYSWKILEDIRNIITKLDDYIY